jgi:DNA replication and repair protein RecF
VTLGTGIEPPHSGEAPTAAMPDRSGAVRRRRFRRSPAVIWLTPAMDGLFSGPASERRRFLDRLVVAVDAEHRSRVSALERRLRSRNRLLEDPGDDPHWLDAVEHETAELAIAVAALRAETVRRSAAQARAKPRDRFAFPLPRSLSGWIEQMLRDHPATEIEDAIAPCCATTAHATPPPAARSMVRI